MVIISSSVGVGRSFAQASLIDFEAVDAYLSTQMKELAIPGAALVIVENDQIIHLKAFDVADGSGRLVTIMQNSFTSKTESQQDGLSVGYRKARRDQYGC